MLSKEDIDDALPRISPGLNKFLRLRNWIESNDFYNNPEFRRLYNGFYRVRRNREFQDLYFPIFQLRREPYFDFEFVLERIFKQTGRYEASFSSKLVATCNEKKPVIDKFVLTKAKLKLPLASTPNRKDEIVKIYNRLGQEMSNYLSSELGVYLIQEFDNKYVFARTIDNMKKLDLVLWQSR
jgi:hypothetical protein